MTDRYSDQAFPAPSMVTQHDAAQGERAHPQKEPSGNEDVVCSLCDESNHPGLAVLLNSILQAGFKGRFSIGHQGKLPAWTAALARRPDGLFETGDALLEFLSLDGAMPLPQYKPEFLRQILRQIAARHTGQTTGLGNLWYFDPNITVRCTWSFFERWVAHGVCLCQEINMGTMPSSHPLRLEWVELAREAGWGEPTHWQERYYSSAFVALNLRHRGFADLWSKAIELARDAIQRNRSGSESRSDAFYLLDQDTLNIAAMYPGAPLTAIGPEGMGWVSGGFTMYHSGSSKPWQKRFLREALLGKPPSNAEKHFLHCAGGPLHPFTPAALQRLRVAANAASLIGRFNNRY